MNELPGKPIHPSETNPSCEGSFTEEFLSRSPEETLDWACRKGRTIDPPAAILLTGSLGTGKTVLARGLAIGLGMEDAGEVCSPSYTLLNTYQAICPIYHLDLYRLSNVHDYENIGLFDLLEDSRAVLIIEWGEPVFAWVSHGWHIHIRDEGSDLRRILCRTF